MQNMLIIFYERNKSSFHFREWKILYVECGAKINFKIKFEITIVIEPMKQHELATYIDKLRLVYIPRNR